MPRLQLTLSTEEFTLLIESLDALADFDEEAAGINQRTDPAYAKEQRAEARRAKALRKKLIGRWGK